MKKWILSCIASLMLLTAFAQGGLQYNKVILLTNTPQTVPAGKVWKATALYGSEYRINECVDWTAGSLHELNSVRCVDPSLWTSAASVRLYYRISTFTVNGTPIVSSITGLGTGSITVYNSNNCTGSSTTRSGWNCANISSDPNILPIWLPSGTVVATGGPSTFLSVIEFNEVP